MKNNKAQSKYKGLGVFFLLVFCVVLVSAAVVFVQVLPISDTIGDSNVSIEWNFTMEDNNPPSEVKINWNGTNTTTFDDNVIVLYNFDNRSSLGENDTHVFDVSGNGNNGTVSGATFNSTGGKYNGAFEFNGSQYIDTVSIDSEQFVTNGVTYGAWVNANDTGRKRPIQQKWGIFAVYFENGNTMTCNVKNETTFATHSVTSTISYNLNEWNHFSCNFNGTTLTSYFNGVKNPESIEVPGGIRDIDGYISIGTAGIDRTEFWEGLIDDVIIFNRSLSSSETQQIYLSSLTKYNTQDWSFLTNQSLSDLNSTFITDSFNYFLCSSNSTGYENCTTLKTITQIIKPTSIVSNFTSSIGNIRSNFYGTNTHFWWLNDAGRIDTDDDGVTDTSSNRTWHREKFLDGNLDNIRGDISIGSYYSGIGNKDAENWLSETSKVITTSDSNCNMPPNWRCGVNGLSDGVGNFSRSADAHGGSFGVNISNNDTIAGEVFSYVLLNLPVSNNYTFSVWMKSSNPGADIKAGWNNGATTACTDSHTGGGGWEHLSCNFSSDTLFSTRLEIRAGKGESLIWDDVNFTQNGIQKDFYVYGLGNQTEIVQWASDNNIKALGIISAAPQFLANVTENCKSSFGTCNINDFYIWEDILIDYINTTTNDGELTSLELEVLNEPYLNSWQVDLTHDNITKATEYVIFYNKTYNSIKNTYPDIVVGGPSGSYELGPNMMQTFLSNMSTGGYSADFCSIHPYAATGEANRYYKTDRMINRINQLINDSSFYGANCSRIIISEWNNVDKTLKNTSSFADEFALEFAYVYQSVLNNYPKNVTLQMYQWSERYRYNNSIYWPEWPQLWNMVTEPALQIPSQPALTNSYNVTKAFGASHSPGSTVYTSTTTSSAVKAVSSKKDNDSFITIINTDTEARNITVDTAGNLTNLYNLETGEEFVSNTGVFQVGVMDSFEILYLGIGNNMSIDVVTLQDLTQTNNGTIEMSIWLRAVNGIKNAAIFIYNSTGDLIFTFFETIIGSPTEYLWNVTTDLGEGTYDWFVNMTDDLDETFTSITRSFTVDETTPSIEYVSPTTSAGQTLRDSGIYINITSSDNENHSVVNNVGMALWQRYNDETADDSSGNNNNGVVNGSTETIDGRLGRAYIFDGIDDEIITTNSESLNITEQITISTWVKFKTNTEFERIVAKSHTSGSQPFSMYALTRVGGTFHPTELEGQVRMELAQGGTQHIVHSTSIPQEGEWVHIVGTYNGTNMSLYYNGVLETSGQGIWDSDSESFVTMSGPIDSNNMPLAIGSDGLSGNYFNGTIDDVIIYNRALTQNEISAMYSAGVTQYDNNITYPIEVLPYGEYNVTSYVQDWGGNINETESRLINLAFPVILNAPANDTVVSSPVTFNCSVDVNNTFVSNISLWDNFTGTWEIRNTTSQIFNYYYNGTSFDVSGQGTVPTDIAWDGSNFWVVNRQNKRVYQYTSAGTYTGTSFDTSGEDDFTFGITWDGSNFWVVGRQNKKVYQYTSAGTYTGTSFDTSGEITTATTITWDGSSFWIIGENKAFEYTSAGAYTGTSFDINIVTNQAVGITWDGLNFWISDDANFPIDHRVYKYTHNGTYTGTSFNVSGEDLSPFGLVYKEETLFIVGSQNNRVFEYIQTDKTVTFTQNISSNETIVGIWNCQACDLNNACSFAPENFTLTVDDEGPTVSVESPNITLNYSYVGNNETLNVTFTDGNLSECWYNYNGTNISIDGCISGVKNSTEFVLIDKLNMTLYANDTFGNLLSEVIEWDYNLFEINQTYEETAFETDFYDFEIYVRTDAASVLLPKLIYKDVPYSATLDLIGDSLYLMTATVTSNASIVGVNNFFWNLTLDGEELSTRTLSQNITEINFSICGGSNDVEYLSIDFRDELTLLSINATIRTSTFNYYIQNILTQKTYTFESGTNQSSYEFCFDPSVENITAGISISYFGNGYPERTFGTTLSLSNVTTNATLDLLDDGSGIYATFEFIDATTKVSLSGVNVKIFDGTTLVIEKTTDDGGIVSEWLNPNILYEIQYTKTGYDGGSQSHRPTSTDTILIEMISDEAIASPFIANGLITLFYPQATDLDANTTYNFGFYSREGAEDIDSMKFTVYDEERNIIGTPNEKSGDGNMSQQPINVKDNRTILVTYELFGEDGGYWRFDRLYYVTVITSTDYSLDQWGKSFNDYFPSDERTVLTNLIWYILWFITMMGGFSFGYNGSYRSKEDYANNITSETRSNLNTGLFFAFVITWVFCYFNLIPFNFPYPESYWGAAGVLWLKQYFMAIVILIPMIPSVKGAIEKYSRRRD